MTVGIFAVFASATNLPWRNTTTREEIAATSCSLCEIKITDSPCATALRIVAKQIIGLLRGQNGGRFIQNKNAGIAVKRLEDFDPLAFPDRQGADLRIGIDA